MDNNSYQFTELWCGMDTKTIIKVWYLYLYRKGFIYLIVVLHSTQENMYSQTGSQHELDLNNLPAFKARHSWESRPCWPTQPKCPLMENMFIFDYHSYHDLGHIKFISQNISILCCRAAYTKSFHFVVYLFLFQCCLQLHLYEEKIGLSKLDVEEDYHQFLTYSCHNSNYEVPFFLLAYSILVEYVPYIFSLFITSATTILRHSQRTMACRAIICTGL